MDEVLYPHQLSRAHKTAADSRQTKKQLVLHVGLFLCCLGLSLCICLHVRRHLQQHTRASAQLAHHSMARHFTRLSATHPRVLPAALLANPAHLQLKRLAILLVHLVQPAQQTPQECQTELPLATTTGPAPATVPARHSHFGALRDRLPARELVKLEALNLRLDRLAPLANCRAKEAVCHACLTARIQNTQYMQSTAAR